MMKTNKLTTLFILLLLTAFSTESCAQWGWGTKGNGNVVKENRSHRGFEGVKVGGSFDVFLRQGNTESVTIEADENLLDLIDTRVSNGILVVSTKKGEGIRNAEKLNVYITVDRLRYIQVSGAADLVAEDAIRAEDLEVHASGSSDIKLLRLRANEVSCSASGSSDIRLLGNAYVLKASLTGSSDLKASDFETEDCYLKLSGSSDARVYASASIDASASGSSDIYCAGNPGRRRVNTSGASDIHF